MTELSAAYFRRFSRRRRRSHRKNPAAETLDRGTTPSSRSKRLCRLRALRRVRCILGRVKNWARCATSSKRQNLSD